MLATYTCLLPELSPSILAQRSCHSHFRGRHSRTKPSGVLTPYNPGTEVIRLTHDSWTVEPESSWGISALDFGQLFTGDLLALPREVCLTRLQFEPTFPNIFSSCGNFVQTPRFVVLFSDEACGVDFALALFNRNDNVTRLLVIAASKIDRAGPSYFRAVAPTNAPTSKEETEPNLLFRFLLCKPSISGSLKKSV